MVERWDVSQNAIGVKSVLQVGWFAGRVFVVFVCFSRGSDPRSARAGAVETHLSILEANLEKVRFSNNSGTFFGMNDFQTG